VLPEIVPPPPGGRRPLIDLFPAPPGGVSEPPDLAIGIAPPPNIASHALARPPEEAAPVVAPPVTYEPFYGLAEKPFSLSTDPKFLYHCIAHDDAAQDLLSAIRRRDGLVVLTGEIGVGKTILCRAVSEELDRRTLASIVLDPFISVEALLQTVLVDFGVISRDDVARGLLAQSSSAELFAKLREFLASLVPLEAFAVVIIDEAQNLPVSVLEEIRALMDLDAQQRLLQIALVGQPSLLKLLARGELRELQQRVAVRSVLRTLAADEIAGYVMHRLSVAGMQARIEFDDLAFARLYQVSAGVPRVVNLVCDRALTLGYNASASVIDESLILTAAYDLDVVPPEPRRWRVLRAALAAVILMALIGAGAAAAAWVFRAPLSRIIAEWTRVPPPPRAPLGRLPPAFAPLPTPPETSTAPPTPPR
jgi:general secretion pathway protein A